MVTKTEFKRTSKGCKQIGKLPVETLEDFDLEEVKSLRENALEMVKALDKAIVKMTPCPYNARTVKQSLNAISHYRFKKASGLCGHHLNPLLEQQVDRALDCGEGSLAFKMCIHIIDFFNHWSGRLDDSYGEGSMFVSGWGDRVNMAIEIMEDYETDEPLCKKMLEAIDGIESSYLENEVQDAQESITMLLEQD